MTDVSFFSMAVEIFEKLASYIKIITKISEELKRC